MLAPETEPADGSRGATNLKENAHQTSSTPNNGVTAPIAELSRLALKDAVLELGAGARKTWDASSAAVFQLWQVAEKRLGVEVDIEDPAIESIFALHVLAVEDLCDRVRAQADATLAAVEVWNQPQLSNASDGFKFIATANGAADDGGNIVAQLQEADEAMAASKAILRSKLQSEVYSVLDQRLKHHDAVRENVRNRKRWRATAATARRDVVRFRKEGNPNRSELRSLSSGQTDSLEEAENRLQEANEKVAELDIAILTLLTELRESSVDDVRRPWAALIQLQADFYLAQQATWATLEEAFVEFVAGDSLAGASSSLPPARSEEADAYKSLK
mmetsp:Transcript_61935/g.119392  ORF Transcript_61935/g.119392 Transcript_61935/m.119392 type:complete len:332 (-) Transcript_61935:8-1003(-)